MLKSTNKEMKTLLFTLNKVIKTGEEIDIFEGITFNLKISLIEKNPPGVLNFHYTGNKDLLVFISR